MFCSPSYALTFATHESELNLYYPSEEIVSISTGTYKAIHLAPSVATVIRADEIKASGARTLAEVLETVPGLHVSLSFARNSSIYSIRGIHTDWNSQVLLLVNGISFNQLITGSRPPLFRLPVENIALIEVIRGPGSAVYGADAFAGVINIITKERLDIDGHIVGVRFGSFGARDGWIQYGGELGGWDIGLSLEYISSDGDRSRIIESDFQTDLDARFGTNASLAPGPLDSRYKLLNSSINLEKKKWSFWLNAWNLQDGGVGPGAFQALDPAGEQENDHYTLAIGYKDDESFEDWRLNSSVSYRVFDQEVRYRILPPGTEVQVAADGNLCIYPGCVPVGTVRFTDGVLGNPGGEQTEIRLEVAGLYEGWHGHRLRSAIGMDQDSFTATETKNFGPGVINGSESSIDGTLTDVTGTPYIFVKQRSRTVRYLSLQDEWRFAADWEMTAGVRYDNYSDFGETINPRLALVWKRDYFLTTKLLYGRAFRAPSLTELYFENNPVVAGNPDLEPETIDMIELVFDYRPGPRRIAILTLFTYHADELIEFVNGTAQNTHAQNGHGLEMEAKWYATDALQLKSNFALQFSEDAQDDTVIPNAPRRQLFLAAAWQPSLPWVLYGQANWVMDRSRAKGDPRPPIADNSTVDLAVRYQPLSNYWAFGVSIKNAFDADNREPSNGIIPGDYPLPGRSVFLEAEHRLRE
ncbi:hypothetical protein Tel_14330 [Candidatus Tenderia electrophaga]|uniref:TonB-dependent receptor n=1 Tax=Candidatus Tenderia electrophaga TaxID=1748243 RepID=A0A0S2TGM2_9GAMM|nr:hypothetical protein Tel_14330 [Candidatus Tenderia electrophaga]